MLQYEISWHPVRGGLCISRCVIVERVAADVVVARDLGADCVICLN